MRERVCEHIPQECCTVSPDLVEHIIVKRPRIRNQESCQFRFGNAAREGRFTVRVQGSRVCAAIDGIENSRNDHLGSSPVKRMEEIEDV